MGHALLLWQVDVGPLLPPDLEVMLQRHTLDTQVYQYGQVRAAVGEGGRVPYVEVLFCRVLAWTSGAALIHS